jgi:hypothetical protein
MCLFSCKIWLGKVSVTTKTGCWKRDGQQESPAHFDGGRGRKSKLGGLGDMIKKLKVFSILKASLHYLPLTLFLYDIF